LKICEYLPELWTETQRSFFESKCRLRVWCIVRRYHTSQPLRQLTIRVI